MEMKGEARLPASRQFVWDALNNPEVLKACIPGCESLNLSGEHEYTATVVSKVGPIKARFEGKVALSNIVVPKSYTLTGEGSGGAAGFAKATIEVGLDAVDEYVTLLRYSVSANVGGKLAQLGSRMIDAAARKSADDFFEAFTREVQNRRSSEGGGAGKSVALDDLLGGISATGGDKEASQTNGEIQAPRKTTGGMSAATNTALPEVRLDTALVAQAATEVLTAELIKVWIADQIAVVTLNRPKSRNAMTYSMWKAMPGILSALQKNPEVRAVILTGAGEDFCAGADIAEFEQVRADAAQAADYETAVDACCDAIYNFDKPTIAVIRGYCLGGGAHLAMSCDFRYADPAAIFGIPAARLSIIYGVRGTRKLVSLVGVTQAKKILFGAERFNAERALAVGFLDHISYGKSGASPTWWERLIGIKPQAAVGDPMIDAREYAARLAENAPLSMAGAKYQLNHMERGTGALDLDEAEAMIAHAAGSEDYREGRLAFSEKRKPNFTGR